MSSGAASNGLRSTRIGYLGTMQDVSSNNQWISYQLPWISSFTRDWDKSIFRIFCLMLIHAHDLIDDAKPLFHFYSKSKTVSGLELSKTTSASIKGKLKGSISRSSAKTKKSKTTWKTRWPMLIDKKRSIYRGKELMLSMWNKSILSSETMSGKRMKLNVRQSPSSKCTTRISATTWKR